MNWSFPLLYPDFRDAELNSIAMSHIPGGGTVVTFTYTLLAADGMGIEQKVRREYDLSQQNDYRDLCVDMRRLGIERPFYQKELNRIAVEVGHGDGLLVELVVGSPEGPGGGYKVQLARCYS
ncbi:MAG: hypothetical protein KC964_01970 [Candidatus Omnitrophica bacterium]|nr:hypothetical protein [Candidatus Omnitrophota bacterium]